MMEKNGDSLDRREFLKLTGILAVSSLTGCQFRTNREQANLALLNGKIITVDAADTIAEAVAVSNGKILQVGSTREIRKLVGEDTQAINLEGRCVTPGLVDSHIHVLYFGKQAWEGFTEIRPPTVNSKESLLAAIDEKARSLQDGEWISGNQGFLLPLDQIPTLEELDAVAPNNPVYLKHMSGQYGIVNTKALQVAGIDENTPNPPGGKIIRNPETGEPTGFLNHYSAQNLVGRYAPGWGERTEDDLYQDLLRGQDLCLSAGYTSGQDVIVGSSKDVAAYRQVAENGDLKMRMYLMQYVPSAAIAKQEIEKAEPFQIEMLTFGGWKMAVDGGGAAGTSLMYDTSLQTSNACYPYYDQEVLNKMVTRYHLEGYQTSFHCSGDQAIDMAINAIEAALDAKPDSNHRHKIEHALWPQEESLKRIRDLGIHISTQPQWISLLGDAYNKISNVETMERFMPLRTELDMGLTLSFGCDVPATPVLEPNWAFAGALTRTTFNNNTYSLDQAITMPEALRIHTMGSAYASFEEDIKGSIEKGKLADMVVWSRDLYNLNPKKDLPDLKAETTIVNGEIVYNSAA